LPQKFLKPQKEPQIWLKNFKSLKKNLKFDSKNSKTSKRT
jgi:hypothetical protein